MLRKVEKKLDEVVSILAMPHPSVTDTKLMSILALEGAIYLEIIAPGFISAKIVQERIPEIEKFGRVEIKVLKNLTTVNPLSNLETHPQREKIQEITEKIQKQWNEIQDERKDGEFFGRKYQQENLLICWNERDGQFICTLSDGVVDEPIEFSLEKLAHPTYYVGKGLAGLFRKKANAIGKGLYRFEQENVKFPESIASDEKVCNNEFLKRFPGI